MSVHYLLHAPWHASVVDGDCQTNCRPLFVLPLLLYCADWSEPAQGPQCHSRLWRRGAGRSVECRCFMRILTWLLVTFCEGVSLLAELCDLNQQLQACKIHVCQQAGPDGLAFILQRGRLWLQVLLQGTTLRWAVIVAHTAALVHWSCACRWQSLIHASTRTPLLWRCLGCGVWGPSLTWRPLMTRGWAPGSS